MSNTKSARRVKITTHMVGQHFGTCGIVRDKSGRKLLETDTFPYGHDRAAYAKAVELAQEKGWVVYAETKE